MCPCVLYPVVAMDAVGIPNYSNTSKLAIFGAQKITGIANLGVIKGTASLEVKNSKRNRELENFASLELRVCELLLYQLF